MSEIRKGKRQFLSDEYVPLEKMVGPSYREDIPQAVDDSKCNFPNCECEVSLCEHMPYKEKQNV